jgi:hypothetical protein
MAQEPRACLKQNDDNIERNPDNEDMVEICRAMLMLVTMSMLM